PATAAAGCGDSAAAAPQPPGSPWFQPGDGTGPTDRPRPGYSAGISQSAAPARHHCPAGSGCPRPTAQPAGPFHLPAPGTSPAPDGTTCATLSSAVTRRVSPVVTWPWSMT